MPATTLETTSKITSKGQLTLPKSVREVLGVETGARVRFVIADGVVTVEAASNHEDPAIGAFLALIENDIAKGHNLHADLPEELAAAMRHAIENVCVDLDEKITGDVSI